MGSIVMQIKKMFSAKITHGDMKATNIILHNEQAVFVDLDSVRLHYKMSKFNQAKSKDIKRFMKNWQSMPRLKAIFAKLLKNIV